MAGLAAWAKSQVDNARAYSILRAAHLLVRMASFIICLHLLQILLWAAFYRWRCLGSWESAIYFSAASYSTVGSGDVVLLQEWRATGPIESISGVLMCALSASLLFAVMARLFETREDGRGRDGG
jgi:hypothetical protein